MSLSPTAVIMDIGQTLTITATPGGGTGSWSYAWSVVSGTCTPFTNSAAITQTFAPTSTGSCVLTVTLSDTGTTGGGVLSPHPITASPATNTGITIDAAPTVSLSPTAVIMDIGQTLTITATPGGGTGSWGYAWSVVSGTCTPFTNSAAITQTFAPTSAGSCVLTVLLSDTGTTGGGVLTPSPITASPATNTGITIDATPTVSISPTAVIMDVGQTLTITATPGGGTGSWGYAWSVVSGTCTPFTNSAAITQTFAPTSTGSCVLTVTLSDTGTTGGGVLTPSPITASPSTNTGITIDAAPTVSLSPTAVIMDIGQTLTITATPGGGTGSWSYAWSVVSGTCTPFTNSAAITQTFTPTSTGSCVLTLLLSDTGTTGGGVLTPSPITASPATNTGITIDAAPTVSISPTAVVMDVGQTLTITATPGGGTGSWGYAWSVVSGTCTPFTNSAAITQTFAPTSAGSCVLTLLLSDTGTTGGGVLSPHPITASPATNTGITIDAAPTVSMSPTTVIMDIGQTLTITATPGGGTGSWSYAWSVVSGTCTPFTNSAAITQTFAPTSAGSCVLTLLVSDTGTTGGGVLSPHPITASPSTNTGITIDAAPTVSISPTAVVMDIGQTLTITATPGGGTGSWSYAWSVVSGTCTPFTNSAAITQTFAPTSAGSCVLTLLVSDTGTTGGGVLSPHPLTASPSTNTGITIDAAPTVSLSPTAVIMDIGQTLTITATPGGGTGSWSYAWSVVSGTCTPFTNSAAITQTFAPTSAGSCVLTVLLSDTGTTGGGVLSPHPLTASPATNTGITIDAAPAVSLSPTAVIMDIGQTLTITATPGGGTGSWGYAWSVVSGTCTPFTNSAAITQTFAPTSTGSCVLTLLVADTGTTGGGVLTPSPITASPATNTGITIDAAPTVSLSPTAVIMDIGQTLTITATPGGGTGSWGYAWSVVSGTCTPFTNSAAITQTFAPTSAGSCVLTLLLSDTGTTGGGVLTPSPITASPATNTGITIDAAPTVSLSPTAVIMDIGQTLTITATPGGGTGSWSYAWSVVSGTCTPFTNSAAITQTFAPTSAGSCVLTVLLSDTGTTGGGVLSPHPLTASPATNTGITIDAAPTVSLSPTAVIMDIGQTLTITATPGGGTGSWGYAWSVVSGTCTPFTNSAAITQTFAPTSTGSCVLTLLLSDTGTTGGGVLSPHPITASPATNTGITIDAAPTVSISPTAVVMDIGQTLTITATPGGGTGSWSYAWSVVSGTCTPFTNSAAITQTFAPTSTGSCVLTVTLSDTGTTGGGVLSPHPLTASPSTNTGITIDAAPTVSLSPTTVAMDLGQTLTITATPGGGTGSFSYVWSNSGSCPAFAASSTATQSYDPSALTSTCVITVTLSDTGTSPGVDLSPVTPTMMPGTPASVTVNPALTAPGAPTLALSTIPSTQSDTVTGTIPSTGTPTYSWVWMYNVGSGTYSLATGVCGTVSGSGALAGATETCTIAGGSLTSGNTYHFKLQVTDSSQGNSGPETQTSSASAALTVDTIDLTGTTPLTGPAGTLVTMVGSGFSPGDGPYDICWLAASGGSCPTSSPSFTATGGGDIPTGTTTTFPGSPDVWLTISDGPIASIVFSPTTATLTLTPSTGPAGSLVTLSGSGYAASTTYYYCFSNSSGGACPVGTTTTFISDPSGNIPTSSAPTITVPSVIAGGYYIEVSELLGSNWIITGNFGVVAASLTLSFTTGPPGSAVALTGTGYGPGITYTYCFTSSATSACTSGATFTATLGTPSAIPTGIEITVPLGTPAGLYHVDISQDPSNFIISGQFDVVLASLTVSPAGGPVGTVVTLSGGGYAAGVSYLMCFGAGMSAACPTGTSTTFTATSGGAIPTGTTLIAPVSSNSYVDVSQGTSNFIESVPFTITTPQIMLSPTQDPVGATVTVTGTGFSWGGTVTMTFGASAISSYSACTIGSASAGHDHGHGQRGLRLHVHGPERRIDRLTR